MAVVEALLELSHYRLESLAGSLTEHRGYCLGLNDDSLPRAFVDAFASVLEPRRLSHSCGGRLCHVGGLEEIQKVFSAQQESQLDWKIDNPWMVAVSPAGHTPQMVEGVKCGPFQGV
jgi:hypothetical protein